MGIFSHHTNCSRCGSRDNLAVYKDGSAYCFGCHYSLPPTLEGRIASYKPKLIQEDLDEPAWKLPSDLTQDFPEEVYKFISKYELTFEELIKHDYYFSRNRSQLWRLFTSGIHSLLHRKQSGSFGNINAAESRVLLQEPRNRVGSHSGLPSSPSPNVLVRDTSRISNSSSFTRIPKSRFYGSKEETYGISGTEPGARCLVLVEDSLSSIKVGRVTHSLPLFGTSIQMAKIGKLAESYKTIVVWLDRDKFREAWEIADKFKWLNKQTGVVLTPLDPKEYNEQQIRKYLTDAGAKLT